MICTLWFHFQSQTSRLLSGGFNSKCVDGLFTIKLRVTEQRIVLLWSFLFFSFLSLASIHKAWRLKQALKVTVTFDNWNVDGYVVKFASLMAPVKRVLFRNKWYVKDVETRKADWACYEPD